jgi:hypothetical protein
MDTVQAALQFPDPMNPYNFLLDGVTDCPYNHMFVRLDTIYANIQNATAVTDAQKMIKKARMQPTDNAVIVYLPYSQEHKAAKVRGIASKFNFNFENSSKAFEKKQKTDPTNGSYLLFNITKIKKCPSKTYLDFIREVNGLLTGDPMLSAMGQDAIKWLNEKGYHV